MVKEVACQQVLLPDHSVHSVQWIDLPEVGELPIGCASFLLERYLNHIRKCTFGMVRPVQTASGVSFRLLVIPLLSFEPPRFDVVNEGERVLLPICGGVLLRKGEADGSFSLAGWKLDAGVRIQAELTGYHPLLLGKVPPSALGRMFYRYTQGFIHRLVTVSYLAVVAGELIGKKVEARVREVPHQEGRKT
ncbi:hypothetical protein [Geomesophilobacter sediminis]|uniref:Uncharacterized protein n=1 Tax=Geomesophilobacter sediminis TaxID=2798584 RepID=A0A8J7LXL4_9BACT|nr:hypothetical protein [Geomesophilobacter sediminis]MBJ6723301.1 hypothetical protein [Geomesophilobacter sediminis]